jgi:hypothetical protein
MSPSPKTTLHPSKSQLQLLDRIVARVFQIKLRELHGTSTKRNISDARLSAMYLQKEMLGMSYPAIARYYNKRSHSTCISAYRTVSGLLTTNSDFIEKINLCRDLFNNYSPDKVKQRYNLNHRIRQQNLRVSATEKTIYLPASRQEALSGLLLSRITTLRKTHNYAVQLTID